MNDMLEKLIMLQILKTMAYSKAEDQKAMLDTILDGANKAAQTVANIRSIKEGNEPKKLEPLAKEPVVEPIQSPSPSPSFFERNDMGLESPEPPKSISQSTSKLDVAPIQSAYNNVNKIRKKLDAMYEQGVMGKAEINELIVDVFTLQTELFQFLKNK